METRFHLSGVLPWIHLLFAAALGVCTSEVGQGLVFESENNFEAMA